MAARVGLTGGIGSGKSTVAALFAELGVMVIDADEVSREVVMPGTTGLAQIVEQFGSDILLDSGALNRKALSEMVFADDDARQWLEGLLHPMIRERMDARAAACEDVYCILEIPLLIESEREVDHVVVVHCPEEIRVARLLTSRQMTREAINRVMHAQASDSERLLCADSVIDNSGDKSALLPQVKSVNDTLLTIFRSR